MVLLAIFHVLIILEILPSGIVWGGQAKDSQSNLVTLEIISLVVTLIFVFIIAAKIGYIEAGKFKKVIKGGVWIMFVYFILNIFGNLASSVLIEKMIFTQSQCFWQSLLSDWQLRSNYLRMIRSRKHCYI